MHAYLIISNNNDLDIKSVLPNLYEPVRSHFFTKIKIGDIPSLNNFLMTTGTESHVIYFDNFLLEAQNSFLKTLEEPIEGKQIVLITKSRAGLLDTVLSRLIIIDIVENNQESRSKNSFIEMSVNDRLDVVKQVLDSEPEDVRSNAQKLISKILNNQNNKTILTFEQKQTLAEMHDYLFNPGTSVKQILEFLAVTL